MDMPLRYKIIANKRLVYVVGTEIVTIDDLVENIKELSEDPLYTAPMRKLVDYRRLEKIELSMKESEIFAQEKERRKRVFDHEQCAIVAPKDVNFGIARMHTSLMNQSTMTAKVFRDLEDARAWLGIEKLSSEELSIA